MKKTQAMMIALFAAATIMHYQKSGVYNYEISKERQEVVTSFENQIEVKNVAEIGDYILTGKAGEKYVVKPFAFAKRYTDNNDGTALAKGECWGYEWTDNVTTFISPWKDKDGNETEMLIEPGDMLVSPTDPANGVSEVYRIKRSEFDQTYQLVLLAKAESQV